MACAGCDECIFEDTTIPADMHEIHITVDAVHTKRFLTFCADNKIKPIVITYGDHYLDPMTSHKFKGTITQANTEITRLVDLMHQADLPPVRIKAETTIANPVVHTNTGYFESHLGIKLLHTDEPRLRHTIAAIPELHLSKNALKSEADIKTIMATYRDRDLTAADFSCNVTHYRDTLEAAGFVIERQIVEFCWVDTNEGHDNLWFEIN